MSLKDWIYKISKVDKILAKNNIKNYKVFYCSQINHYLLPVCFILYGGFFIFNEIWFKYLFVLYFLVLYFTGNYLHSSFALTDKEFISNQSKFSF